MSIKTFVTFQESSEITKIRIDDREILDTLGSREEAIAVQLKELLTSVIGAVEQSISNEGELSVEINGSLGMKASGGVKYVLFNLGAEASSNSTMKVTFKTTIKPNKEPVKQA